MLQIPFEALEYDKKADKIGSGSYGEVYRGWWQGQYTVAIKELTGSLTADAEKDLYREAGIMAYVTKESKEPYPAVRLFGLAVAKPDYALVMEYLPHGTLFDLLQRQSEAKLPWDLRYQLAIDIADGIALLHRQHILHRDLRSHNVLLTITDGRLRAKLSDFGLSTVKSSVRATTTSKKTDSVGTRAWMAPELHKRGGQSSPASDMYSYGMVLWELLTHAIPFADAQGDASLISEWISKGETETIPGECPPKLAALIKQCWSLIVETRPTIETVQKELKELAAAYPLSAQTQAIIKKLEENQQKREIQWNTRWQGKRRDTEQKQKEELREVEIKKQAEIDKLQQQHQAEQSALQKRMEQLKLSQEQQSAQLAAAEEEKRRLAAEKQAEIERIKQQHQAGLKGTQEDLKCQTPTQTPQSTPPLQTFSLSQNPFTIIALQPVIPRLDRGIQSVDEKTLNQLLQYVAEGEQDKAEALIQKNKNLLLNAGTVTDLSGREFKQITAFQYALWAMDWHMWTMIQKYLPKEAQAQQLQELEAKSTEHGNHFNLKTASDYLEQSWKIFPQKTDVWARVMGEVQRGFPVHVVNEYCRSDRSFYPCPQEWESKFLRTQELDVWNPRQGKYIKISWFKSFSPEYELGKNYAFYRYNEARPASVTWGGGVFPSLGLRPCLWADFYALQSLWKTRTQQLESLKSQLLFTVSQNQGLKTELKELKYETSVQPPKLMTPVSQVISQTIMAPPKPKVTPEQLALQDQLIAACKQGDVKAVEVLFKRGAKPDIANAKDEQPLGAAVWGMCPDVVNTLLKQAGGVASMTWQECENHNLKYYKEVFIVEKFQPPIWGDWYNLLVKINDNLFLRTFHLNQVNKTLPKDEPMDWKELKEGIKHQYESTKQHLYKRTSSRLYCNVGRPNEIVQTEAGYTDFKTQIKKSIESAIQPTLGNTF